MYVSDPTRLNRRSPNGDSVYRYPGPRNPTSRYPTRLNTRSPDGDSVYHLKCTRNPTRQTPIFDCLHIQSWKSLTIGLGVMTTAALLRDVAVRDIRSGSMCLGDLVRTSRVAPRIDYECTQYGPARQRSALNPTAKPKLGSKRSTRLVQTAICRGASASVRKKRGRTVVMAVKDWRWYDWAVRASDVDIPPHSSAAPKPWCL